MKRSSISMEGLTWDSCVSNPYIWDYWVILYKKKLCFNPVIYYLNQDNENADIEYNINNMKVLEWSGDDSSS